MRSNSKRSSRGVAIIYVTVSMAMMLGFCSFAIDLGRVQVAKTQLQTATDAAARFAASGLQNVIFGHSAAASNAAASAAENLVDGTPLVIDQTNDVTTGVWDAVHHTFTPNSDPTASNAVKITAQRSAARGTAIPMTFARVLGVSSCDVHASAIAYVVKGANQTYTVPATSNPFLAGMPSGTVSSLNNPHNNPDYAPQASPLKATGISIVPGAAMTFDGINGGANNFASSVLYSADGNTGWICNNTNGNEHGIADMSPVSTGDCVNGGGAPINSLVGIFLDDSQPDSTPAPTSLDFSTDSQRGFSTLKPKLKQIFFIGDGRDAGGATQSFVVPTGATRLYLATWDTYEWNNNVGSFNVTVHQPAVITTVQ